MLGPRILRNQPPDHVRAALTLAPLVYACSWNFASTALFAILYTKIEAEKLASAKEKRSVMAKFWSELRTKPLDAVVIREINCDTPLPSDLSSEKRCQIQRLRGLKVHIPTLAQDLISSLGSPPKNREPSAVPKAVAAPLSERKITYVPKPSCSNPLFLLTMVFYRAFRGVLADLIFHKIFRT